MMITVSVNDAVGCYITRDSLHKSTYTVMLVDPAYVSPGINMFCLLDNIQTVVVC